MVNGKCMFKDMVVVVVLFLFFVFSFEGFLFVLLDVRFFFEVSNLIYVRFNINLG